MAPYRKHAAEVGFARIRPRTQSEKQSKKIRRTFFET
jgi:hypothetical protein